MRSWYIYTLSHPTTGEIRYVGVAHRKQRYAEHIYSVKRLKTHCATWIKSLLKVGLKPTLSTVENGKGPDWAEAERRWIAYYRASGVRLTNHTDGGEGTLGWKPSAEQRRAIGEKTRAFHTGLKRSAEVRLILSKAQQASRERERLAGIKRVMPPRSKETLQRMAIAQRGKKGSPELKAKLSKLHSDPNGPYQTPEYRQKQRVAFLARPADVRAAMSSNQKGKTKSVETRQRMSEAALRRWARQRGEL